MENVCWKNHYVQAPSIWREEIIQKDIESVVREPKGRPEDVSATQHTVKQYKMST